MLSKKRHLLAESRASVTQKISLSQTETSLISSGANPLFAIILEGERLSKRKVGDDFLLVQETSPMAKIDVERPSKRLAEDKPILLKPTTSKVPKITNKPQNPFLCVVPTCEIVVSAHVFGFSRETALSEHYKTHVSKGEVTKFSQNSLLMFSGCGEVKLKAQTCQGCGRGDSKP